MFSNEVSKFVSGSSAFRDGRHPLDNKSRTPSTKVDQT
jgi:hypothetical protein